MLKLIIRKSIDSNIYVAYGKIRLFTGKTGMIWFGGLTFSEAINKALEYYEPNTRSKRLP